MRRIATVGNFDGCHRGHQAVFDTLLQEGKSRELSPLVITFRNHPLDIIAPERSPRTLSTPDGKRECIYKYGEFQTECMMLDFTPELCTLTAREWMERMKDQYDIEALVLGYDNTFGSDGRTLSQQDYMRIGRETGIEIIIAPAVEGCSSTLARKALSEGEIRQATEILGRYYRLPGTITHGDRIGSSIGIPTANLTPTHNMVIPRAGVYAGFLRLPDGEYRQAVINVGHRPTVDEKFTHKLRIEAHLPGWEGNIYDEQTEILFVDRLRDERPFSSLQKLREQIDDDIRCMRILLAQAPKVSVTIPVYNGEKFLADTIHSLLCQSMPDWEVIFVDDSSTDGSLNLLRRYAAQDSRIRVYHKKNERFACLGVVYALKHVRGEWTLYMSQDDRVSPDLFESALQMADTSGDIDALLPLMRRWQRSDDRSTEGELYPGPETGVCMTGKEAFLLSLNWQIHAFALFRTDLIMKLGYNTDYLNSDEYESRRQFLACRRVCTCRGIFYYHTGNEDAISRKWRPEMTGYIDCDAMLLALAIQEDMDSPEVRTEIGRRLADDALTVYDIAKKAGASKQEMTGIRSAIVRTRNIWNVRGVSRRMRIHLLMITLFFTILHPKYARKR